MICALSRFTLGSFVLAALFGCSSSSAPASAAPNSAGASSLADFDAPSGTVECPADMGLDSYAPGLVKPGINGAFTFTLVSSTPAPPALHDNTFLVQVSSAEGTPLAGQLSATLYMPVHGHYSPTPVGMSFDPASATFTLDPVDFFMLGLWRVTLTFEHAASSSAGSAGAADPGAPTDSAVFQFCLD
jgi:hypothetical protein